MGHCSSWRYTLCWSCLHRWAVPAPLAGICMYNYIRVCVCHFKFQMRILCHLSPTIPLMFTIPYHSFHSYPVGQAHCIHSIQRITERKRRKPFPGTRDLGTFDPGRVLRSPPTWFCICLTKDCHQPGFQYSFGTQEMCAHFPCFEVGQRK